MTTIQFIEKLRSSLKNNLPGWDTQKQFLPITKIPGLEYKTTAPLRKGAVLACLYENQGELMTILIERTQDSSPHSGQIAFPGGKYEDIDENQTNTALREAFEEVGLNPSELEILGKLTPVQIPVSGFTVLPVIAWHSSIPKLNASPLEVKTLIVTPLEKLLNNLAIKTLTVRNNEIETPCFSTNGFNIWGATAMVLGELKEIINNMPK
jgi:8-oxo-dGTP pyrophosphatase MutT (NUDIX family)